MTRRRAAPDRTKVCVTCGRTFSWRKAWARDWDQVRYCSAGCRSDKPGRLDAALEESIRTLLAARARGNTICPSEAARAVAPADWRPLMERTRRAARRMVAEGEVEILQKGRVVADPSTTRGPIRIRSRQAP